MEEKCPVTQRKTLQRKDILVKVPWLQAKQKELLTWRQKDLGVLSIPFSHRGAGRGGSHTCPGRGLRASEKQRQSQLALRTGKHAAGTRLVLQASVSLHFLKWNGILYLCTKKQQESLTQMFFSGMFLHKNNQECSKGISGRGLNVSIARIYN